MLQQPKIQKQPQFPPAPQPQSPTAPNKLHQYFNNSSFLLQQQQLLVFIKDLPQINLKQIKSVNNLISLLIKQNQLIGEKCQQQIGLMKQEYLKHDKLVRVSKEMRMEKERVEKEKREVQEELRRVKAVGEKDTGKEEEREMRERKLQAESMKNMVLLKEANQKIVKYEQLLTVLSAEDYKKCDELIKYNLGGQLQQNLEQYSQNQRKRFKYFAKVKGVVQQFCLRLDKISKVVSPTVLASELSTETAGMMELINQLCDHNKKKRKKTEGSSQKTIFLASEYGSQRNLGFFQGMIQKLTESAESNNASKEEIAYELEELRKSLQQTKNYYEGIVKNLKDQYQGKDEQIQKRFQLKQQTIKFYQQQLQKHSQSNKALTKQSQSLNETLQSTLKQLQQKNKLIQCQQQQIDKLENSTRSQIEQIKMETQTRIQELKKMASLKIQQREEIIREFNQRRKKEQADHQAEIGELRFKVKLAQEECDQKEKELRVQAKSLSNFENEQLKLQNLNKQLSTQIEKLKKQTAQFQQKLTRKTKQGDQFKQTLNSLEHEKTLQSAYINELQAKTETLNNKIKTLQSKAKNDAANKKEITAMKNTIVEQKQRSEQYQAYCGQLKDENQRLKAVVKEMKKELQEVYLRLSELKHIEAQRERLYLEAQNSERIRDGLLKQHEELKFEMLKLQAENKKIHLELKHFKNIVGRLKFLQQE